MFALALSWWAVAVRFAVAGIGIGGVADSVDPIAEKRRIFMEKNGDYYRWRHKDRDEAFMTRPEFEQIKSGVN